MESIDPSTNFRVQKAIERGFVPEDYTELQLRVGLEELHEAPLTALGRFAMAVEPESTPQAS